MKRVREEQGIPKLFTRLRWEAWLSAKGMLEQAREKFERMLKEHEPEPPTPAWKEN